MLRGLCACVAAAHAFFSWLHQPGYGNWSRSLQFREEWFLTPPTRTLSQRKLPRWSLWAESEIDTEPIRPAASVCSGGSSDVAVCPFAHRCNFVRLETSALIISCLRGYCYTFLLHLF